jgi:hypothetical protein
MGVSDQKTRHVVKYAERVTNNVSISIRLNYFRDVHELFEVGFDWYFAPFLLALTRPSDAAINNHPEAYRGRK